jgi:hypothetical protein
LKPKDASKDILEFAEAGITLVQCILFILEGNPSISTLSLRIPVQCPTLIGLNLPLASLIGIAEKKKKLLTCTPETTRAKLEQLCSARFIHGGQKTTTRHAKALSKAKGLISLLALIK